MFSPVQETKNSGKMMALKSSSSNVVIPKFLSSDDNGNLSLFDLDKHTTENDFSAKSLTSTTSVTAPTLNITGDNLKIASNGNITSKADISCNNITSSAKVTGGQLCIGSTCINENQLKQLIRVDHNAQIKPSEYYAMEGDTLLFEHYQNVTGLGWSLVKTIVPGNKSVRIFQQAYKILWTFATLGTDVSKMFTRYSLGNKNEIAADATRNGWTAWKSDVYVGSGNNWKLTTDDGHLRAYNDKNEAAFTVHNVPGSGAWSYTSQLLKTGDKVTMYDSGSTGNIKMAGGYVSAPSGTKSYDLTGSNALQINKV
jgi:hypothetical protein